jgi:hypothetical protein
MGRRPMCSLIPIGCPCLIIDEVDVGQSEERWW